MYDYVEDCCGGVVASTRHDIVLTITFILSFATAGSVPRTLQLPELLNMAVYCDVEQCTNVAVHVYFEGGKKACDSCFRKFDFPEVVELFEDLQYPNLHSSLRISGLNPTDAIKLTDSFLSKPIGISARPGIMFIALKAGTAFDKKRTIRIRPNSMNEACAGIRVDFYEGGRADFEKNTLIGQRILLKKNYELTFFLREKDSNLVVTAKSENEEEEEELFRTGAFRDGDDEIDDGDCLMTQYFDESLSRWAGRITRVQSRLNSVHLRMENIRTILTDNQINTIEDQLHSTFSWLVKFTNSGFRMYSNSLIGEDVASADRSVDNDGDQQEEEEGGGGKGGDVMKQFVFDTEGEEAAAFEEVHVSLTESEDILGTVYKVATVEPPEKEVKVEFGGSMSGGSMSGGSVSEGAEERSSVSGEGEVVDHVVVLDDFESRNDP